MLNMCFVDINNVLKAHYGVFNGSSKQLTRDFSHIPYNASFQIRSSLYRGLLTEHLLGPCGVRVSKKKGPRIRTQQKIHIKQSHIQNAVVVDAGYLEVCVKYPICGNFEYSQLHLNKSVPRLAVEFSKATHQLPFSSKIGKQIQDAFSDLEVSAFASRGSYTNTVSKCIAEFFILSTTESSTRGTLIDHLKKKRWNWMIFQP
ncbi:hypothetical protein TNCV_5044521 [Trichonephila clavipes]|uniref:Uncharacterized protein n=1 Tax=Trichonephila clavipes TaxID=2585209 RepID=A0A8X6WHA2_TRICX|nr:hypothetical protein TNCV_5044521 [Trichonephila clavipes]